MAQKKFIKFLKKEIKKHGLLKVSQEIDIHESNLSRWASGIHKPTYQAALNVIKYSQGKLTVDDFYDLFK